MSGGTEEYQQNETELKQRFLREKIMDEGYSADEFVEFLEKRRDDGSNIEVWTFKELMWEVEEFKEYLKPRSNDTEVQHLFESIQNFTLNELASNPKTNVTILKQEKVKWGLLSTKCVFTIQTQPLNYTVKRSFTEFQGLRALLVKDHPFTYIPPCQCSKERIAFLQRFLNSILDIGILRNSDHLLKFLRDAKFEVPKSIKSIEQMLPQILQKDKEFTIKENLQRLKSTFEKEGIKPDRGKVEALSDNLDEYVEKSVPMMSKLKYLAFDMKAILDTLSEKLFEFNSTMTQILNFHANFAKKTEDVPEKFTKDFMAQQLKDGINGWAAHCLETKRLIHDHLGLFYHFRKHELFSLQELGNVRKQLKRKLETEHKLHTQKQQKLFKEKNIEEWGTPSDQIEDKMEDVLADFSKASKYILPENKLKIQRLDSFYQFMNYNFLMEYVKFQQRDQKHLLRNFGNFGEKMNKISSNSGVLWNIFNQEESLSFIKKTKTMNVELVELGLD